jgi:hypothetical protein
MIPFQRSQLWSVCIPILTRLQFGPDGRTAVRDRERVTQGLPPIGVEPPVDWPGQDPEAPEHPGGRRTIYQIVPAMQSYRNNLTALSQICNVSTLDLDF